MPQKLGGHFDVYETTLGKGTFSRIRFAVDSRTNVSYAMKILDKSKLSRSSLMENVKNEIAIMKMIDHKNVVNAKEMFASNSKIFLVLDLMMGGNLALKLTQQSHLSEEKSRFYIQQLYHGVQYCHDMGIILNGISLKSLLLDSKGGLKISDFGLSCLIAHAECGPSIKFPFESTSCLFFAPEIVANGRYGDVKADIWSMAAVLFNLVSGYPPCAPHDDSSVLPTKSTVSIPESFSIGLQSLLIASLDVSPSTRYSIKDFKDHTWCSGAIDNEDAEKLPVKSDILPFDPMSHTPSPKSAPTAQSPSSPTIEPYSIFSIICNPFQFSFFASDGGISTTGATAKMPDDQRYNPIGDRGIPRAAPQIATLEEQHQYSYHEEESGSSCPDENTASILSSKVVYRKGNQFLYRR